MKSNYFIIKDFTIDNIIIWDKDKHPDLNHGGDGIIEMTNELIEYTGFTPNIGDKFTTIGNIYTVPPGAFISSDKG